MANLYYNKVVLCGKLTQNPGDNLKAVGNNKTSVIRVNVAVNRPKIKGQDQKVDFIPVQFWGKTAEIVATYFVKGSTIFVEGELNLESYKDGQGNNKTFAVVNAQKFYFVDGKAEAASFTPAGEETAKEAYEAVPEETLPF